MVMLAPNILPSNLIPIMSSAIPPLSGLDAQVSSSENSHFLGVSDGYGRDDNYWPASLDVNNSEMCLGSIAAPANSEVGQDVEMDDVWKIMLEDDMNDEGEEEQQEEGEDEEEGEDKEEGEKEQQDEDEEEEQEEDEEEEEPDEATNINHIIPSTEEEREEMVSSGAELYSIPSTEEEREEMVNSGAELHSIPSTEEEREVQEEGEEEDDEVIIINHIIPSTEEEREGMVSSDTDIHIIPSTEEDNEVMNEEVVEEEPDIIHIQSTASTTSTQSTNSLLRYSDIERFGEGTEMRSIEEPTQYNGGICHHMIMYRMDVESW